MPGYNVPAAPALGHLPRDIHVLNQWAANIVASLGSITESLQSNGLTAGGAFALARVSSLPTGNLGANGYVEIPVGKAKLFVQWGSVSITCAFTSGSGSASQSVTFPVAFPAGIYFITAGNSTAQNINLICTAPTKTGFTAEILPQSGLTFSGTVTFYWLALGS